MNCNFIDQNFQELVWTILSPKFGDEIQRPLWPLWGSYVQVWSYYTLNSTSRKPQLISWPLSSSTGSDLFAFIIKNLVNIGRGDFERVCCQFCDNLLIVNDLAWRFLTNKFATPSPHVDFELFKDPNFSQILGLDFSGWIFQFARAKYCRSNDYCRF